MVGMNWHLVGNWYQSILTIFISPLSIDTQKCFWPVPGTIQYPQFFIWPVSDTHCYPKTFFLLVLATYGYPKHFIVPAPGSHRYSNFFLTGSRYASVLKFSILRRVPDGTQVTGNPEPILVQIRTSIITLKTSVKFKNLIS